MKMTVPFLRLLVHWRSLVIVLVPLALSPLIAIGSKVGILNVACFIIFISRKNLKDIDDRGCRTFIRHCWLTKHT